MKTALTSWSISRDVPAPLTHWEPAPKSLPPDLLDRWRRGLADWSAPSMSRNALERVPNPETRVVVTGQQPEIWGGPLYSLYKAATALDIAESMSTVDAPAVAVFWIGADDADWGEVGWGWATWTAIPRLFARF